jgi:hypothetical protein
VAGSPIEWLLVHPAGATTALAWDTEKECGMLNVGDEAPDFELQGVIGERREKFRLSDHRGQQNIVLAFYPADFTPA